MANLQVMEKRWGPSVGSCFCSLSEVEAVLKELEKMSERCGKCSGLGLWEIAGNRTTARQTKKKQKQILGLFSLPVSDFLVPLTSQIQ